MYWTWKNKLKENMATLCLSIKNCTIILLFSDYKSVYNLYEIYTLSDEVN